MRSENHFLSGLGMKKVLHATRVNAARILAGLGILLCAGALEAGTQETGAVSPQPFDLQQFIDDAVAAGEKRIVIPPGRYVVTPRRQMHLLLDGLENVEIIADGVEMVCTETTRAVTIRNCVNTTLRGLTIDYDPLAFTQGFVTAVDPDNMWIEFTLIDGYPDNEFTLFHRVYDPVTHELKYPGSAVKEVLPVGPRSYRMVREDGYRTPPGIGTVVPGDILAMNNVYAPNGNIPHAVVVQDCINCTLEDVRVYASNNFAFLEYNCDNTTYLRCIVDRRSPESDPVSRAYPRLHSTTADAFHSKFAFRGPQILNCTAKYMGDDCVNICGEYNLVMGTSNNTIRILSLKEPKIAVGDTLELLSYTGERLPDAKAVLISEDGLVTEEESAFMLEQKMNRNTKLFHSRPDTKAYTVTIDRDVELPRGSVIGSANRMGNGFRVEGNDFGHNRSRGILIKGSYGSVRGNKITGTWGNAILVNPEWWWLESGSSRFLDIRDNQISDCRDIPILVTAGSGSGTRSPAGALEGIAIVGNTIVEGKLPNIYVTGTRRLDISLNRLVLTGGGQEIGSPWTRELLVLEGKTFAPIMTLQCEDVREAGNVIEDTASKDVP